jgi:hypothetical protein
MKEQSIFQLERPMILAWLFAVLVVLGPTLFLISWEQINSDPMKNRPTFKMVCGYTVSASGKTISHCRMVPIKY